MTRCSKTTCSLIYYLFNLLFDLLSELGVSSDAKPRKRLRYRKIQITSKDLVKRNQLCIICLVSVAGILVGTQIKVNNLTAIYGYQSVKATLLTSESGWRGIEEKEDSR
jgi:hypothetical protein